MSAERLHPPYAQPFATPGRRLLALLLALVLALVPALLPWVSPAAALNDEQQLVVEAWRLVNQSFVDPGRFEQVHWKNLRQKALEQPISTASQAYAAIEAMLQPLGDPYTRLLRPEEYATLRSNTQGMVNGVGLQLGLRSLDQKIVVIAALDGSPAAAAAIASGSEVVRVNGQTCAELGLDKTAAALRGKAGSQVLLTLRSPQGKEREVELTRSQVDLRPVRSRILQVDGRSLGYLQITQFAEQVPAEAAEALASLQKQGIEGLILDLRNNSGGLVSAGVAVANGLLDGQSIVETEDRGGISSPQVAQAGQLFSGPMLTLVNGGTASASEILAGALQDNGRSELMGSRTFGKGLIQTLINLGDQSGLAVTVARYLTPSGHDIQNQGIVPNVELPGEEPLNPGGEGDTWLEQASQRLAEQVRIPAAPRATQAAAT